MPALKYKPERTFPSMNALHGVRGSWEGGQPGRSLPLTPGVWTHIGTIPANSMVTAIGIAVGAVAAPAGATLDIQFGETTQGEAVITASPLSAVGLVFAAAGVGGYRPNRTRVFGRLNGTLQTGGQFNVLVQYYSKQD